MTEDADFKRLVRRRMRETGEAYTEARAQMREAAPERPEWVILHALPDAEIEVQQFFLHRDNQQVLDALIPTYDNRKFAPGLVLARIKPRTSPKALVDQAWISGYCGVEGSPDLLNWSGVRQYLSIYRLNILSSNQPQQQFVHYQPQRQFVGGVHPRRYFVSRPPLPPIDEVRLSELFDRMTVGMVAARRLKDNGNIAEDHLLDEVEAGLKARAEFVCSKLYLVKRAVELMGEVQTIRGAKLSRSDLENYGVEGLARSIEPSRRSSLRQFDPYATWWIRQVISSHVMEILPIRFQDAPIG